MKVSHYCLTRSHSFGSKGGLHPRQQGATALGWLFVISLIGFFALLIIRVVPLYIDHYAIQGVLDSIAESKEAPKLSRNELRGRLALKLTINNLRNIDLNKIVIKRQDDGSRLLFLDNHARTPFISNIFIVIEFKESAVIPSL